MSTLVGMARDRQSIRLRKYDYTSAGAYFVTLCAHQRKDLFGEIWKGVMYPDDWGDIVRETWLEIPRHHPHVQTDAFVVMPNHIHGILVFDRRGLPWQTTTPPPGLGYRVPGSLGSVVGMFKSAVTKRINDLHDAHGIPIWQRNYYERIIRDEDELNAVRAYLENNPLAWDTDGENVAYRASLLR